MARARQIKPGFFLNEDLATVHPLGRLFFAGLWCIADRDGRLEDRPSKLRAAVLPYDRADGEKLVAELADKGFLLRYEIDGQRYLQIVNFAQHQNPHPREAPSTIPAPFESESRGFSGTSNGNTGTSNVKSGTSRALPSLSSSPSLPSLSSIPSGDQIPPTPRSKRGNPPLPVDEPFIASLVAEYAGTWTEAEVRERVEAALNHKASDRWKDKRLGVRGWLRRDAERAPTPLRKASGYLQPVPSDAYAHLIHRSYE